MKGKIMKKNIHPIERVVRIVGGAIIASLAFWGPTNLWFLLGIVPLLTGFVGWCPPYAILGISTCKRET
jgi:hypothetical protein